MNGIAQILPLGVTGAQLLGIGIYRRPGLDLHLSRELGHTSPAMVQRVYAHLGTIRHRAEVVEYRVEQHAGTLGERLTALQRLGL